MALPKLEVPTFETKLPSTSKAVKYRPFLVKEHKVLLMLKDAESSEISRIVHEIVDACTFNKLNMKDLAFFDLVHLFIELRKVSIGEMLDLVVNCDCGNAIQHQANLNDAKVVTKPDHSSRIRLTRKIAVDLRYPHLDESMEAYTTTDTDRTLELLASCIKGVHEDNEFHDARESSKQELLDWLDGLGAKQLTDIMKFFDTMPKVTLPVSTECPKCKKKHDLSLEGLDNFFV